MEPYIKHKLKKKISKEIGIELIRLGDNWAGIISSEKELWLSEEKCSRELISAEGNMSRKSLMIITYLNQIKL